jgi:hypothetical protein
MAYKDLHLVSTHSDFIKTVKIAILKKASDVMIEERVATVRKEKYNKRINLAQLVLSNTEVQAKQFALHIASHPDLLVLVDDDSQLSYFGNEGTTMDESVDNILNSVWNIRAGVTHEDMQPALEGGS